MVVTMILLGVILVHPARSQSERLPRQSNPLEMTTSDPLLPQSPLERPLTPQERSSLEISLNDLNTQATAQFRVGNLDQAFEIWYRELRLRRVLGGLAEVEALGRVAEFAWKEGRREDLQNITQRLEMIQKQTTEGVSPELLTALGQAYENARSPRQAAQVYTRLLETVQQTGNLDTQVSLLQKIGQLHLAWFNYTDAATAYEQLLSVAQSRQGNVNIATYLQQLAYIYDRASQPENAIEAKEQLIQEYQRQGQRAPIPAVKISLGKNYNTLQQPEKASQHYQEAFEIAWSLQQYNYASEALQHLANLYSTYEQPNATLNIYQELIKVQQYSYDHYGLMNTYDAMGRIFLKQQNYPQALVVYRKALELAQSLNYQEYYYSSQVKLLERQ